MFSLSSLLAKIVSGLCLITIIPTVIDTAILYVLPGRARYRDSVFELENSTNATPSNQSTNSDGQQPVGVVDAGEALSQGQDPNEGAALSLGHDPNEGEPLAPLEDPPRHSQPDTSQKDQDETEEISMPTVVSAIPQSGVPHEGRTTQRRRPEQCPDEQ